MTAWVHNVAQRFQRVSGWFGGLPGKAADVLPVRSSVRTVTSSTRSGAPIRFR